MKAIKLYEKLEKDFIVPKMSDEWAEEMGAVSDFLSDNFKKRSMGLVCDFTEEIERVYNAVFPSEKIMRKILNDGIRNAMLFVHHPSIWDIRKVPEVFQQMDRNLLEKFKERKISIYNLHIPLDNWGKYSTSVSLARILGIRPEKSFAPYFGGMAGVFGRTDLMKVEDLRKKFENVVGHQTGFYPYGSGEVRNNIVAVVAGGGMSESLEEIVQNDVNVLITGISVKNDHSKKSHEFAEKHKINILGGTHYSTEKFACMALVEYFGKIGLPSEFIEDEPVMEDI